MFVVYAPRVTRAVKKLQNLYCTFSAQAGQIAKRSRAHALVMPFCFYQLGQTGNLLAVVEQIVY